MSGEDKIDIDEAKNNLEDAESKALGAKDDLNSLSNQALEALRQAADELTAILKSNASGTVAALKDASHNASNNMSDLAGNARDISLDRLDDLSAAVRRKPLASLALAVGAGMIIGMMRRNDR